MTRRPPCPWRFRPELALDREDSSREAAGAGGTRAQLSGRCTFTSRLPLNDAAALLTCQALALPERYW